jgi:hypothetical protein
VTAWQRGDSRHDSGLTTLCYQLLESAGLVMHTPDGNRNMFQLQPQGFEEASKWLEGFWNEALSRFALVAENTKPEES